VASTARPEFDVRYTAASWRQTRRLGPLLLPRETGALAQLLVPLATSLAVTRGGWAAWLLATAEVAVFLAHEPFMIIANLRGPKARFEHLGRAWRQLVLLPLLALGCLGPALLLGPAGTALTLLPPVLPALALLPLVLGRLEKTVEGELLVSAALALAAFPVAWAGGASLAVAATVSGVYLLALTDATLAVRRVTARALRATTRQRLLAPIALAGAGLLLLSLLAGSGRLPPVAAWAPLPVLLFNLFLTIRPPHLRHIRKVGWTLAACTLGTMGLLLGGLP